MNRVLFLTLLLAWVPAQASELAGRVIMVRGDVTAIDAEGAARSLGRRDPVYVTDTLRTAADGKVQIRFVDNALLALKPNTELRISTYQVTPGESGGTILMELVEGGFRTLTGSIGKGDKSDYEVRTPVASIGIRGTLYSIMLQEQALLAGVWEGAIALSSDIGQFELGAGADFNFAVLDESGFSGLLAPPTELQDTTPRTMNRSRSTARAPASDNNRDDSESPADNESVSVSMNDNDAALTDTDLVDTTASETADDVSNQAELAANDDNSGTETAAPQPEAKTSNTESASDRELASNDESTDMINDTEMTADGSDMAADSSDTLSSDAIDSDGNGTSTTPTVAEATTEEPALNPLEGEEEGATDTNIEIVDKDNNIVDACSRPNAPADCGTSSGGDPDTPTVPEPPTSADLRLSDQEYAVFLKSDRIGAVLSRGEQAGGIAIVIDDAEPVFYTTNEGNSTEVIRYAGTSVQRDTPLPGVEWGIWAGTTEQPVQSYPDISNPDVVDSRAETALWVTATPIRATDMAGLYGTVDFSSDAAGASFIGVNGEGQTLSQVDGRFTLNFDNGQISDGKLAAVFGAADAWKIEFNGNIEYDRQNAAMLNMLLLKGDHNGGALNLESSEFGGVLIAPDASDFLGGFSLQDLQGNTADGLVVWPLQNRR
ncbi:FecR domain-containing protein [Bacterioplanes sanyensis]|nr:FecR domain-containing protein [Bacterioplanes sanyensis]